MKHTFLFHRAHAAELEAAIVLVVEAAEPDPEKVLTALEVGVDEWVDKTEEGKKLHRDACEDTNIGDLAEDLGDWDDSMIHEYLREQNISVVGIYGFPAACYQHYDRVLCHVQLDTAKE